MPSCQPGTRLTSSAALHARPKTTGGYPEPNQTPVVKYHPCQCVYTEKILEGPCRRITNPQSQGKLKQDGFACSKNSPCLLHVLEARNNLIQILILPYLTNSHKPEFIRSFQILPHCEPGTPEAQRIIRRTNVWRTLTMN